MKKIIAAALIAAMVLTCAAGCGKKTIDHEDESRVLYSDSDTATDTEETDTSAESKKAESKKEESKKEESKKEESKKESKAESKKSSSKAASSKAASSKKSSTTRSVYTPSKAASSSAVSSKAAETSSKNESSRVTSSTDTDTEKLTDTDTSKETDTDTLFDPETDTEITGSDPFDAIEDLVFSYSGYVIRLGNDPVEMMEELGDPLDIIDIGMHTYGPIMEYDYSDKGFVVTARPRYENTDEYMIDSIQIVSPKVSTEKDITIGSSVENMLSIYGTENCYKDYGMYTYKMFDAGNYLRFVEDDGFITGIIISLGDY